MHCTAEKPGSCEKKKVIHIRVKIPPLAVNAQQKMSDTSTVLRDCKAGSTPGDDAVWEFWF